MRLIGTIDNPKLCEKFSAYLDSKGIEHQVEVIVNKDWGSEDYGSAECQIWVISEDYVDQTQGMQAQLASLVSHGVFVSYPALKVVLIESGVSWLPAFCWRMSKFWRGLRIEVPWVERAPIEIVREHVRLTLQPFDAPPSAEAVERLLEHLGSDDMLLFSSDYPHWQFDGDDALPDGFPEALTSRLLTGNPLDTYARMGGTA